MASEHIIASGAIFYAKSTNRILLLQKANGKNQYTWGLVGGTNLSTENPWQGLQREIEEEIGTLPTILKTLPLEKFVSNDNVFNFHTYFCVIESEFIPELSAEHSAWGWFTLSALPKPVHKGLQQSLRNKVINNKIQTIIDIIDILIDY
jgi:8-oxo-dGTP pyrophosphatase MutT (NUDIX family)